MTRAKFFFVFSRAPKFWGLEPVFPNGRSNITIDVLGELSPPIPNKATFSLRQSVVLTCIFIYISYIQPMIASPFVVTAAKVV